MFKTLKDFDFTNKKTLVRCDFNVPIDDKGNILDDFRIKESLPTIKYLLSQKAKIILMAHLGELNGKVVEILKMDRVKEKLAELLKMPVAKADDCVGETVKKQIENLKAGEILLLENLRFHKEEIENDLDFARELALLPARRSLGEGGCDVYVNEAFSVCHRNNASVVGVAQFLPSFAGLLLEKEILNLNKVLQNPMHPMTAIVGGKKVETKAKFINEISKIADFVITSGLIEKEILDKNIELKYPKKIIAPKENLIGADVDAKTEKIFENIILKSKTIIWNGPVGKIEDKNYRQGTLGIAEAIIKSGAFSVVGGGETVEFLKMENLMGKFSHISTGGGAMLAYLAGESLPGIVALG